MVVVNNWDKVIPVARFYHWQGTPTAKLKGMLPDNLQCDSQFCSWFYHWQGTPTPKLKWYVT